MLRRPTGRPFTWDGNAMFHGTSGQITVQQVEILIERITLGAKICRTRSLGCPASFVLHKRLNESENHLQPPAGDFCAVKESLSDSLQPAQQGKACLGFAAPWVLGSCHHLVLPNARAGMHPAREPRGFTEAPHPFSVQRRNSARWATWLESWSADPDLVKLPETYLWAPICTGLLPLVI